jgi:hypothetical protein
MNDATSAEERARRLHDRATRGLALSAAERAELDAWYAEQDEAERLLLNMSASEASAPVLQAQVNEALIRLRAAAEQVQELAAQNEALRGEVSVLQRQLREHPVTHAS